VRLLVLLFAFSLALAQQVVLYPSFAWIRQSVNLPASQWVWSIPYALYAHLVPGSVQLFGPRLRSETLEPPKELYAGERVAFWWQGQWREATVLDPARPLFEVRGRFLTQLPGPIAYLNPDALEPRVRFRYQGAGPAQLSYLVRGLSWSLDYTLGEGTLKGWALIQNNLMPLRPQSLEAITGSTPLAGPMIFASRSVLPLSGPPGLFRYRLPAQALPLGQTLLPFLEASVHPEYTWSYQGPFVTAERIALERGERFQAPQDLPAGTVSIYSSGVFVGQAEIGTVSQGTWVQLNLGPDPKGVAERSLTRLGPRTYQVVTRILNPLHQSVRLTFAEEFPQPFQLEIQGVERLPDGYRWVETLAPGQQAVLTYAVTLPAQP